MTPDQTQIAVQTAYEVTQRDHEGRELLHLGMIAGILEMALPPKLTRAQQLKMKIDYYTAKARAERSPRAALVYMDEVVRLTSQWLTASIQESISPLFKKP